jgi:hypothetical protein
MTVSVAGVAQIDIRSYTTATDTFYWKRYIRVASPPRANLKRHRSSGSSALVASFLVRRSEYLPELSVDSTNPVSDREVTKLLFPMDLDGDRHPDMVYSGPIDGEPGMVRIWLARGTDYQLVFEDYQYISKLKTESGRLVELQTADAGNDTGYLYFTRDYRISYGKGDPVFIKGKQTVIYKNTEEPPQFLEVPFTFTSRTDTLMLRASAARQNEPFIPSLGSFGNIVARYRSTCQGTALARKITGPGNTWYFVEMSPAVVPSASIFYGTEKASHLSAWLGVGRGNPPAPMTTSRGF